MAGCRLAQDRGNTARRIQTKTLQNIFSEALLSIRTEIRTDRGQIVSASGSRSKSNRRTIWLASMQRIWKARLDIDGPSFCGVHSYSDRPADTHRKDKKVLRILELPFDIDPVLARATLRSGTLQVVLPRSREAGLFRDQTCAPSADGCLGNIFAPLEIRRAYCQRRREKPDPLWLFHFSS